MERRKNERCTDLEQSKRLAEFLPIESADMCYLSKDGRGIEFFEEPVVKDGTLEDDDIPCWSLAALLNVLPSATLDSSDDHHYRLHCMERYTEWYDNAIDSCVAMIERLHELNLL